MPRDEMLSSSAHLWDMLRYREELLGICKGRSLADLEQGRVFRLACDRLIEIVGEASRRIDRTTRAGHPEINWRGIEAQRHVLAHEYGDVDLEKIWRVISIHVPVLVEQLRRITPEPPADPLPER